MDTNNKLMLQAGTILHGTYKIEKVLGQGSFGITYLAEHTNLGKKVAIKEFFMKELNSRGEDGSITGMSDSSLSQNYCQKFKKEAINLSRLDHPNIVRVTDSFSENGTFYYVMDFIEGQNLNDYIKSHYIDEAEAVSIIKSVSDALIYMHEEKHMLHLDLKPGNVMRRNDGHIFLIDFGLSKHYSTDGQPETSTTIGLGTAGYAPIEQGNKAKNGEFRPTIDVYALGATFYKLLTRETPPPASDLVSDDELLENKLREKGVSDNLIKVVTEAMCPNVRRRTQSVRDFKNNIEVLIEKQMPIGNEPEETIVEKGLENTIVAHPNYSVAATSKEQIYSPNDVELNEPEGDMLEKEEEKYSVFSFNGRVGAEIYEHFFFVMFISIFIPVIMSWLSHDSGVFSNLLKNIYLVWCLFCIYVIACVGTKRCHDRGCSGLYMLWPINWRTELELDGEPYDNKYGKSGNGISKNSLKLLVFIFMIFIVIFIGLIYICPELGYYYCY